MIAWNSFDNSYPEPNIPFLAYDQFLEIYEILSLIKTSDSFIWTNMRGEIVNAKPTHWRKLVKCADKKKKLTQ
jgi:hypothetical protein